MNVDTIRANIYNYSQERGTILIWEDSIKEFLHKKNLDYKSVTPEFFIYECNKGFLEPYQDGYKITRKGIVVYRKMTGAPSREDTLKKIKKVLETLDDGSGLTVKEISNVLQVSESSVQNNLNKLLNEEKAVVLEDSRPKKYTLTGQKQLFF